MHVCIAHGGDLSEPSGGTDRIAAFAQALNRDNHNVTLVAPTPKSALHDRFDGYDLVEVSVPSKGVADQLLRAIAVARRAQTVAKKHDAVIQFEHSTLAGVATYLGCTGFILDMHDLAFESPLYTSLPAGRFIKHFIRHIEGRALRHATEILTVSERMQDLASEEWDVPDSRFSVIPNGYFEETIAPFREVPTVDRRVVFLGTLHPKVNAGAIINIAEHSEVDEMIVIGDGKRRSDLKAAKEQRDLSTLEITGRLPDDEAFRTLASAAVAINPQFASELQEASSPVKLYYYAALGCPMVLTEGPDTVAQLRDAGAAKALSSEADFAATVADLLRKDTVREEMSQRASEIGENWTWRARGQALSQVYDTLSL